MPPYDHSAAAIHYRAAAHRASVNDRRDCLYTAASGLFDNGQARICIAGTHIIVSPANVDFCRFVWRKGFVQSKLPDVSAKCIEVDGPPQTERRMRFFAFGRLHCRHGKWHSAYCL